MAETPYPDFFIHISYEKSKKILEQMTKNVCSIYLNDGMTEIGTGYFCKIPLSKNNILPSLMISKNIFNEYFVNQKQNIITIKTKGTEHQKFLDLNKRKIYQSKIFPLNFIEIYEETDGIKDFFEIDEIQTNCINKYKNSPIYMIFKDKKDLFVSYGYINNTFQTDKFFSLSHSCKWSGVSSGSPILNLNNNKIIGINICSNNDNEGIFLDFPRDNIPINIFGKNKSTDSNEKSKEISDQISKKMCRININNNDATNGIGFFCKIPLPGNKILPALITNKHIINENFFKQKDMNINIKTKDMESPKFIDLSGRKIYKSLLFDLNLIEIFEDTDEIKDFFEMDEIHANYINSYINTPIYMIYNGEKDFQQSFGNINKIFQAEKFFAFSHSCNCSGGSSGSPILNLKNNKIIGLNISNSNDNKGVFLDFSRDIITSYNIEAKNLSLNYINNSSTGIFNSIIYTNGFDLSLKKGFINFDLDESSRLNAIIQMLTSIKEIYELMDNGEYNNNKINKFNHIFILTSFFYKAFIEVYKKGEFEKNPSLKEMDIILKYLNNNLNTKINSNLNALSTSEYLLFILGQLHEELLSYPDNIPRQEKLISLENNFGEINTSKSQFYHYYNQTYTKTVISNLFNWIRRAKRTCNICNQSSYSFQAYPLIVFDLDHIVNYMNQRGKQINLDLKNLFIINSMIRYNNNTNDTCPLCKQMGGSNINYSLQTSPQYFIIVINRNKPISLSYKEEFELPIDGNSDIYYNKYKLIGVIMKEGQEGKQFSCIMKNGDDEKIGKKIKNWIEFQDEKVNDFIIEEGMNNSEQEIKIFHPLNAKILIYKGMNSNC